MGLIGCHVSIAGGIEKAPKRGYNYGCEAIQIFTSNMRRWKSKSLKEKDIQKFKENIKQYNIQTVVTHVNYLINLANPDKKKRQKSLDSFEEEINRCDVLGIPYIVFHPGSHLGKGEEYGIKTIAESLNYLFKNTKDTEPMLLLETTAGQGNTLGYKFEHLRKIMDLCNYKERLGVCYDTCHAFSAGYDITSNDSYNKTFQKLFDIIGKDNLKAFHFNDSKNPVGSRKDRHANLGEGSIGWNAFYRIVSDERFDNIPMLLETPNGEEYWHKEIQKLKNNQEE